MGRIGLCVFCLLKFSVAMCILLVKKLESLLFCVRVNIVSGDNYPTVPIVADDIFGYIAGAKRYSRPRGFNIAGSSRAPPSPPPFRRLWFVGYRGSVVLCAAHLSSSVENLPVPCDLSRNCCTRKN